MSISLRLDRITRETGYLVGFNPMKRKRKNGWPEENPRPYSLYRQHGTQWAYVASFKDAEALERNWRGRAGC